MQEWIADNPSALGEELLIIQKEFAGFADTNERLDLLALDKQGNIVVIENKLDDSGRDVTWQVLKYASYCSTLSKAQIKDIYQEYLNKTAQGNAEEKLSEFFGGDYAELSVNKGQTQRIIIVAGSFRKEVTSTVLWLMNYRLRIQCFKVTPFVMPNEELVVNFEQIIPMQDSEEYIISMADKTQSDINAQEESKLRFSIRLNFWRKFLDAMNAKSDLFSNVSPVRTSGLSTGAGISGASYQLIAAQKYARVELVFSRSDIEENKQLFELLSEHKEDIHKAFGEELDWERLDDKKSSRVSFRLDDVSIYNETDQPRMIEFLVEHMIKLHAAVKEPLASVKARIAEL